MFSLYHTNKKNVYRFAHTFLFLIWLSCNIKHTNQSASAWWNQVSQHQLTNCHLNIKLIIHLTKVVINNIIKIIMKNLFINACVRGTDSRTLVIAKDILKNIQGPTTELVLNNAHLQPLTSVTLALREKLIENCDFSHPIFDYAKQFASADTIIIAAPHWDLAFPALLKIYLENICVSGITFKYNNAQPIGLCKAKKLIYVTTSGGPIFADFGYNYIKAVATTLFGIKDTVCFKAENLDINNISANEVLTKATITKFE